MNSNLAALVLGGMLGFVFGMIAGWKLAFARVARALDEEVKQLSAVIERLDA